jgi:hypothetical protein
MSGTYDGGPRESRLVVNFRATGLHDRLSILFSGYRFFFYVWGALDVI